MKCIKQTRILIVEDEELIGTSLKHALECFRGYEVDHACTGRDAIAHLEVHHYDIIITDLNLPDYKEFELIKEIRRMAWDMPVITMSAYYPDSIFHEIRTQDIFKCIDKPFEIKEVISGIEAALGLHVQAGTE
jgi:DNA-binding response OmpR family regulator